MNFEFNYIILNNSFRTTAWLDAGGKNTVQLCHRVLSLLTYLNSFCLWIMDKIFV